ncbi:MAG: prepilin-type N-terminal cleavage/methylation domain-containing protein [Chthoniobacterales bacterium]
MNLYVSLRCEFSPKRQGFTLVELLATVAIIGVLASLILTATGNIRVAGNKAKCISNQRQIGLALHNYASEHRGEFPPTTHSSGSFRKDKSWIYELAPFIENVDEVRICPADPPKRQERIRKMNATSYSLNDLVFDDYQYNSFLKIPKPTKTLLLFIISEDRTPSQTRDHIHGGQWNTWIEVLNDIEVDRHRMGGRASDRLSGSANYLYADGHVENISASDFKANLDKSINPAKVPE